VKSVVPLLGKHAGPCLHGCQTALDHALTTAPEVRDPAVLQRLKAVAGRVLNR
jgi:5'-methylthioadenosine phosphorylase